MGMMDDFDNLEFEETLAEESGPPGDSNRTFLVVAGILGAILLIALIAIAAYAVLILPQRDVGQQTQVAAINATNTAIAEEVELTAIAKQITNTPTSTATMPPSETPVPTSTSTPVIAPTNTPVETLAGSPDPATETVAALLTQQAGGDEEATPVPTATALPDTGFADDVGAPELLLIAGVLMVVIFLSRRLRTSSN